MCLLAEPWGDFREALDGDGEGGSQGVFLGLGFGLRGVILLREAVVGSMKLLLNWGRAGPDGPSTSGLASSPSEQAREVSRGGARKTS